MNTTFVPGVTATLLSRPRPCMGLGMDVWGMSGTDFRGTLLRFGRQFAEIFAVALREIGM